MSSRKRLMKKRLFVLLIVMLMVLSSCKLVINENDDENEIVATVNGQPITKKDLLDCYHAYRNYYNLTDNNEKTKYFIDDRNTLLESAYKTLIEYQLVMQYGSKMASTDVTEEMKKTIDDEIASIKQAIESGAQSIAEETVAEDPNLDLEYVKQKRIEERLKYRGISTGEYERARTKELIITSVKSQITADYEPTEKAIKNYYDTYLDIQKNAILRDISAYDNYTMESVNLFEPAGFYYVKNLLIALPDDVQKTLSELRAAGKDDEANELRDKELAKIRDKAQQIYNRIMAGESYEELLEQYGEDPGMKEGSAYAKEGYRVCEGLTTYEKNFVEASLSLEKAGDISKPTGSDFGYYIIKLVRITEEREIPLDEAREGIKKVLIASKSSEYYDEYYENWIRNAKIVEYKQKIYE